MVGITSFGAYVPRYRLQRSTIAAANTWHNAGLKGLAKGERAMANWDEDSVTMAVEAARDGLTGVNREAVTGVFLASTSLPFADRAQAGICAAALNLREDIQTLDFTSSQRVGTSGLIAALQAAESSGGPVLFLASDHRRMKPGSEGEMQQGDGAAALVLGGNAPDIAHVLATVSHAHDFVDHYRGADQEFDEGWETRWIRDDGYGKLVPPVVKAALEKAGIDGGSITHFCMPCVFKGVANKIAKRAGMPDTAVRDNLMAVMGEAGTAHAMIMLVDALQDARPGDRIMVVGFGQGVDALIVEVTDAIHNLPARKGVKGFLKRRKEETNYFKYLAFNHLIEVEKGKRGEQDNMAILTAQWRNHKAVLGLVGGKCRETGVIQFPPSRYSVNPQNHSLDTQEDYPLADVPAKIMSFTADNLTYTPEPPAHYGMVVFEEGGRMMADFTDVDPDTVQVGQQMRMVFRIKRIDERRGYHHYFWKAVPAVDPSEAA